MSDYHDHLMDTALPPTPADDARNARITLAEALIVDGVDDPSQDVAAEDKADLKAVLEMVGLK